MSATAVRERPILFSAPMVRAILDGTKTQTRRVVKFDADDPEFGPVNFDGYSPETFDVVASLGMEPTGARTYKNKYGRVGDRLWVRETWRPVDGFGNWDLAVIYAADGVVRHFEDGDIDVGDWVRPKAAARGNVTSLFMPRWASRLTLEITNVRVERLNEISEADAKAEGLSAWAKGRIWVPDGPPLVKYGIADKDGLPGNDDPGSWPWTEWCVSPEGAYAKLWDSINGKKHPWASNPWVWVIEFKPPTEPDHA